MYARDVLTVEAGNPEARLLLARTQIAKGEIAEAGRTVVALVKEVPSVAAVHTTNGALQYAKRNRPAAREAFVRALMLTPGDLGALQWLVMLDLEEKKPADARARMDARLEETPEDARVLLLAARTHASTGDVATAERYLRRAVAADPLLLDAYGSLTQLYVAQGTLPQARAEFGEVVKRQPESVAARTVLGMLYEMEGKDADAEREYETALALDQRAGIAANNLAWILAETDRDLNRALALAQTAYAQLPDDARIQDTLGWVYFKKGMYPQAVDQLQRAANADARNPMTHYHLGLALVRSGNSQRGTAALREALRLNPTFEKAADAQKTLAQMPL